MDNSHTCHALGSNSLGSILQKVSSNCAKIRKGVPRLAETVLEQLGQVDVLVNNAACSYINLFQCMPPEQVRRLYAVNLTAVVELSRLLLPSMISRHTGCIVNISSMWGETGASCEVDYSVTKGAVLAFTRALAKEVGPSGIRVNAVSPGTIATDMVAHLPQETLDELAKETPLGRLGKPEIAPSARTEAVLIPALHWKIESLTSAS